MQEYWINNDDVALYAKSYGQPHHPTLVFLHGFPDCHQSWMCQVEALQHSYHVVVFDMRGVGSSSCSARDDAYKIEYLLSDIQAVIDAVVGHHKKVHLVGHDWGSVIGWSFASESQYSHRVLSYTSMSGPHLGLVPRWLVNGIKSGNARRIQGVLKQIFFSWYIYLFNVPRLPEWILRIRGQKIWPKVLAENGVPQGDRYLKASADQVKRRWLHSINLYRDNPLSLPPAPEDSGITMPVQLIFPKQDRFVSEALFVGYERYVMDLRRHEIDGMHWAHHSHAMQFNGLLIRFIEEIESLGKA
ncbi:hypothetical protein A9Q99_10520 [Gammaproteobacteria bacterium 45_16_T64]|nr:hypothetical protein A9Q99_10520 [Gammaproteobacteria bacterium 45_16_T64]